MTGKMTAHKIVIGEEGTDDTVAGAQYLKLDYINWLRSGMRG